MAVPGGAGVAARAGAAGETLSAGRGSGGAALPSPQLSAGPAEGGPGFVSSGGRAAPKSWDRTLLRAGRDRTDHLVPTSPAWAGIQPRTTTRPGRSKPHPTWP